MDLTFAGLLLIPLFVSTKIENFFQRWTQHITNSLALSVATDLLRSKAELIAENALLRQQLIVLHRQVKRPQLTPADRLWLVTLTHCLRNWKSALLIIKPETLLKWHRLGFRLFWKFKSRCRGGRSPLPTETITLIQQLARENRLWGAERIRGALLKLGISVAKRTIQKYICRVRSSSSQTWATFLKNQASQIWACDFLPVIDLRFQFLYVFFIIELATRRVVHFGVTRSPTDMWVAQQLREATPNGEAPSFLIRDNDRKFGASFKRVAEATGIEVLRTPYRAPKANAMCERFQGSVRRECLDHILVLNERHLQRTVKEYITYFNHARPHQGIKQKIPLPLDIDMSGKGKIVGIPVLNGLHHDYQRVQCDQNQRG